MANLGVVTGYNSIETGYYCLGNASLTTGNGMASGLGKEFPVKKCSRFPGYANIICRNQMRGFHGRGLQGLTQRTLDGWHITLVLWPKVS